MDAGGVGKKGGVAGSGAEGVRGRGAEGEERTGEDEVERKPEVGGNQVKSGANRTETVAQERGPGHTRHQGNCGDKKRGPRRELGGMGPGTLEPVRRRGERNESGE